MFRRLGPLVGIDAHPHLLRHSFATAAIKGGAKVHGVMAALGHASLATTGQYLHADDEDLEHVAAVISTVLSPSSLEDPNP